MGWIHIQFNQIWAGLVDNNRQKALALCMVYPSMSKRPWLKLLINKYSLPLPIYQSTLTDTEFKAADVSITAFPRAVIPLLPHIFEIVIVTKRFVTLNCDLALWSLTECGFEKI